MNYTEEIDNIQNELIDWYIYLQKVRKNIQVKQVKNPFVQIKDAKQIEKFLTGKASKYTLCGPQVWQSQNLNTTMSIVFPWVYNDGIEGFHEINNTIYYFKKLDLPDEITYEYLVKDCK